MAGVIVGTAWRYGERQNRIEGLQVKFVELSSEIPPGQKQVLKNAADAIHELYRGE